jgi:hypothetical protein
MLDEIQHSPDRQIRLFDLGADKVDDLANGDPGIPCEGLAVLLRKIDTIHQLSVDVLDVSSSIESRQVDDSQAGCDRRLRYQCEQAWNLCDRRDARARALPGPGVQLCGPAEKLTHVITFPPWIV